MSNKNCEKKQQKRRHSLPIELHFEIARFFTCTKILQFLSNHIRRNKNTSRHDSVGGDENNNIFDRILLELPVIGQLPDYIIDHFFLGGGPNLVQQSSAAAASSTNVVDAGDDMMVFGHWQCECFFCVALISNSTKLKCWKKWV
jgi:hypothetical protein